jgi:seryl-tRNA synthetase
MKIFFFQNLKFCFSTQRKLPNLRKYSDVKFDFKSFINNLPVHISNIKNRKVEADAELVRKYYNDYILQLDDMNQMRRQLNKTKQLSSEYIKSGKPMDQLGKDKKKYQDDIQKMQLQLEEIESKLMSEMLKIPNSTHPDSPVGSEDKSNIIKLVGEKRMY